MRSRVLLPVLLSACWSTPPPPVDPLRTCPTQDEAACTVEIDFLRNRTYDPYARCDGRCRAWLHADPTAAVRYFCQLKGDSSSGTSDVTSLFSFFLWPGYRPNIPDQPAREIVPSNDVARLLNLFLDAGCPRGRVVAWCGQTGTSVSLFGVAGDWSDTLDALNRAEQIYGPTSGFRDLREAALEKSVR